MANLVISSLLLRVLIAAGGSQLRLNGDDPKVMMGECTVATTCAGGPAVLYMTTNLSHGLRHARLAGVPASCASASDIATPCAAMGEPEYPPLWWCDYFLASEGALFSSIGPHKANIHWINNAPGPVSMYATVDCPDPGLAIINEAAKISGVEPGQQLNTQLVIRHHLTPLPFRGLEGGDVANFSVGRPREVVEKFRFTGGVQSFTAPAGVTTFDVKVWGAGGSGGFGYPSSMGGHGGAGGATFATVTNFADGASFEITVGQSRASSDSTRPCAVSSACSFTRSEYLTFGGGGLGGGRDSQRRGGDGGGGSWLKLGSEWVVVAGGGGGGNGQYVGDSHGSRSLRHGGSGGGESGMDGDGDGTVPTGGGQTVGGRAGSGVDWSGMVRGSGSPPCTSMAEGACLASPGALGEGGYATGGAVPRDVNYDAAGGGGGGFFGGGGGSGGKQNMIAQSGAGGSAYANPAYTSSHAFYLTDRDADHKADVAPKADDPDFERVHAFGGAGSTALSSVGGGGLVVIRYATHSIAPPPSPPANIKRQAFAYTGGVQSFTAPAGVTTFDVKVWGAGGSGGFGYPSSMGGHGGAGGATFATVTNFADGASFEITVGQSRASSDSTRPCAVSSACSFTRSEYLTFGGGGLGGGRDSQRRGGDGGGGSWLKLGSEWVVVAGGGGGGNGQYVGDSHGSRSLRHGGSGGGESGMDGDGDGTVPTGGGQTVGGRAGSGVDWSGMVRGSGSPPCTSMAEGACLASPGALGEGGYATGGAVPRDVNYDAAGGGGGGFFGGGGGSGGKQNMIAQSGAGGSAYANPAYTSSHAFYLTDRDADHKADVAPKADDPDYASGRAVGGAGSTSSSTAGGPGLVVITWLEP